MLSGSGPLIPPPKPGGRPREQEMQEILNAIFYLLRKSILFT